MFVWTHDHQQAFEILKQALVTAPVFTLPNFTKPFSIQTDGQILLLQNGHPLGFLIKALGPRNQGLSTYEKEYLAIIMAIAQWRS